MLFYLLLGMIILLAAALGAILFLYLSIQRDLKEVRNQSRYIREQDTNLLIHSESTDQSVHEMINEFNQNLTSMRRLRQQIVREETEIKNVITNLSHDLRTPITSIMGYAQLLRKELLTERQQEYLAIILSKVETLRALVEQLFVYSVTLEEELEPQKEDITPILEEAIILYYEEIEKKGIRLNLKLEEQSVYGFIHKESLRRVFMNIVSNAVKYGKEEMEIEQTGTQICFRNKTELIDSIDTHKIFDRFFTVAQNRINGSMGLGLTIARELTEKMGGQITASKQGEYLEIMLDLRTEKN